MPEAQHTNALIHEKSPYLLQHAHNPVDWMPWGEAAFKKAREENKPVFLSVGYSTCHWCHVMERESFENEDLAKVLNKHFVSIKVDREERPDVDLTYMTYVQASTGHGGWPMNVFLTPELQPFFGGTYFPPTDKGGRMGFKSLLLEIVKVWENDAGSIRERSAEGMRRLQAHINDEQLHVDAEIDVVLKKAYDDSSSAFDFHEAGFGGAPKFPRPVTLVMLWRLKKYLAGKEAHDSEWCGQMAAKTLTAMAHGGMRDHIGGGFHRYSVDAYWHIPHYEKMLYDQAQLITAYAEGYQNTGIEFFAEIAREIIAYCKRDLRHAQGAFFSAEDADSFTDETRTKKGEGAFYVWTAQEIDDLLGKNEGSIFRYATGARRDGNARPESDPHGELKGLNTLFRAFSPKKTAEYFKIDESKVEDILTRGRKTLFEARLKRPRPHLDDKIITAWNGLMISALAKASSALGDEDCLKMATETAQFIFENLSSHGKELRRNWRDGAAGAPAFAPDYATLIQGLLDLYEAGFDVRWLRWAVDLQKEFDEKYWDPKQGGYFTTGAGIPNSILQVKEDSDSAEPSPNSVGALNLLRLGAMLARDDLKEQAAKMLRLFGNSLQKSPFSVPFMVTALDFMHYGDMEIVLVGSREDADFKALAHEVHKRFLPHAVVLHADGGEGQKFLAEKNAAMASMKLVDGKAAAYVCRKQVCQAPVVAVAELVKLLEAK